MKRVLVTGATGFIGRQSIQPLLDRGFQVHATYTSTPPQSEHSITWHKVDLLRDGEAGRLCAQIKPTHLLHFAWYVNAEDYKTSSENDRWEKASFDLIQAFEKHAGERAVFAGTCMEYDWNMPADFFSETTSVINPNTRYGAAKNRTHLACAKFTQEHGISFAWGRIFNLYGPYEAPKRLVPSIISALSRDSIPQIVAGAVIRDYSYVKDVADAFAALTDNAVSGTVNIASGQPISLKAVALSIAEIMGKTELVDSIPETLSETEPARIVADTTRLRKEVGWSPSRTTETGLKETVAWWSEINTRTL